MKKVINLSHTTPFLVQPQQYDCTIGRFLSLDPLMDKFPEQSPYSYANNNPISFKDPTGLEPEGEKGKDEVQTQQTLDDVDFFNIFNYFKDENNIDIGPPGKMNRDVFFEKYLIEKTLRLGAELNRLGVSEINDDGNKISWKFNGIPMDVTYSKSKGYSNYNKLELVSFVTEGFKTILDNDESGFAKETIGLYNGLHLDMSMNGNQLAAIWNTKCDKNWSGLSGFSTWKNSAERKSDGSGCKLRLQQGLIYIANDFFEDPYGAGEKLGYSNEIEYLGHNTTESREFWQVLAHEIGHGIYSTFNKIGNYNNGEIYPELFLTNIYNRANSDKKYKGKKQ